MCDHRIRNHLGHTIGVPSFTRLEELNEGARIVRHWNVERSGCVRFSVAGLCCVAPLIMPLEFRYGSSTVRSTPGAPAISDSGMHPPRLNRLLVVVAGLALVQGSTSWVNVAPITGEDPCDVDGCLNRCSAKYPGKISDMRDTYYCSKGCVHLTAGKIDDRDEYCKVPVSKREASCNAFCDQHAATKQESIDECKYGCGF